MRSVEARSSGSSELSCDQMRRKEDMSLISTSLGVKSCRAVMKRTRCRVFGAAALVRVRLTLAVVLEVFSPE